MMQLSVHLRSSSDGGGSDATQALRLSTLSRGAVVKRNAARQTVRGVSQELSRNPNPMPPGTPWMADPVTAAWHDHDPEAGRALAACLYETLSQELRGIEALGAEVKDLSVGLIVFPSFLDGHTEVLLSWTVTEPEIRAFYPAQSGYRHRKPVEGRTFTAVRTPAGQLRE
jgi:hypothetical protein